ncbi:hypothetical protein ABH924_003307 [Arthrobacter sp. GAS37]
MIRICRKTTGEDKGDLPPAPVPGFRSLGFHDESFQSQFAQTLTGETVTEADRPEALMAATTHVHTGA